MGDQAFKYIIVGANRTGASAVEGIHEKDPNGSILLIGSEVFMPYDRPPTSKKLWFDQKKIQGVFAFDTEFYSQSKAEVKTGVTVTGVDSANKTITDDKGRTYRYEKLLLATGGVPRRLDIPGGDFWDICYYRYLNDYLQMRHDSGEGKTAVVIGGGFIGSELAAALTQNKADVSMIFPEAYLVERVFPKSLGRALETSYRERGIKVWTGDIPVSIEKKDGKFVTHTRNGRQFESDILLVGAGILPLLDLAKMAGVRTDNGIIVNEFCQSSNPDIYAAGDNALFPYIALGQQMRVEHWDNALNQGKYAGMNMAGANQKYDYMPYFWSDLFEFGYEAVGELDSRLETFADWEQENDTGVIYYLKDGRVRGVMTCNIYGRMDGARELIKSGRQVTAEDLRGYITSGRSQELEVRSQ